MRGITSRVNIIWRNRLNSTILRQVEDVTANISNNSAVYTDQLITPPLNVNDSGKVYYCEVSINSTFKITSFDRFVLNFISKYFNMQIHRLYIAINYFTVLYCNAYNYTASKMHDFYIHSYVVASYMHICTAYNVFILQYHLAMWQPIVLESRSTELLLLLNVVQILEFPMIWMDDAKLVQAQVNLLVYIASYVLV